MLHSTFRRPALVCGLALLVAASGVAAVLTMVQPPSAPRVVPAALPLDRPFTRHMLLVVVDGLRYDVATDPTRMPRFAEAMRRHRSAEVWAGPITMTTSAVLAYGTGQRGGLEQIVRNMVPTQPSHESWLATTARRGLSVVTVGDPAWAEMYGPALAASYLDPVHLAVDVDFNDRTFAETRAARAGQPTFLVSHFVTPDHQGHAWGVFSDRYRSHIRDYDTRLADLVAEFGPDWTVIVTSDHGAADTGTHGTDIVVERRVPIYAYGPGIAAPTGVGGRVEQVDLAGTMAVLLGVPPPAHGRGRVLIDWLAASPDVRATIACADADRAVSYAQAVSTTPLTSLRTALGACAAGATPEIRRDAARFAAREADRAIGNGTTAPVVVGGLELAGSLFLALLVVGVVAPGVRPVTVLAASALVAVSVVLVYGLERLPGDWPNALRGSLGMALNGAAVLALFAPAKSLAWLVAREDFAPLLVPGLLIVTYPPATRIESYLLLPVGILLLAAARAHSTGARARPSTGSGQAVNWSVVPTTLGARPSNGERAPSRRAARAVILRIIGVFAGEAGLLGACFRFSDTLLVALAVFLAVCGFAEGPFAEWTLGHPRAIRAIAVLVTLIWTFLRRREIAGRGRDEARGGTSQLATLAAVAALGCLMGRPFVPPLVGRSLVCVLGLGALAAALRRRPRMALDLALASYMWIGRDMEIPAFLVTLALADGVGQLAAGPAGEAAGQPSRATVLLAVTLAFCLVFVQRLVLQGSLDFAHLDWRAGGFNDPQTPVWVLTAALIWKHAMGMCLVLGAFLVHFRDRARDVLLRSLVLAGLARVLALIAMFTVGRASFWTGTQILSDLPHAMLTLLLVPAMWLGSSVARQWLAGARSPIEDRSAAFAAEV